ncbi:acyl carrier protein [Planktothrix sp. FACHB-1355]|uniref:Acyl carrier protein n=1 Tax=Aerosakkonema funiforme FACHB-1375 TaxID=2949571 RepID=A0A926VIW5_9CYAN|nr:MULTISPECIES: acyl carrier protein [Oscillatoriales]MBD2183507.1 acyl carrier protein [Aerosakkonema funiforme FACHB-1375]MBD3557946.1 acyl carrier protein [Planktothrix sp. FACHB-1355]
MQEISTKIKAFLSKFFRNYDLQPDEDIFAVGFVNSMFAMQLVLFIEQEFQIAIENEDLEFDNFRTIDAMTRLIDKKMVVLAGK